MFITALIKKVKIKVFKIYRKHQKPNFSAKNG